MSYLSVKGVLFQLVDALELMSIALHHVKRVLISFEDFRLIELLISTSFELPLSLDQHISRPFPLHSQPGCLLLIRVGVHHQRKPQSVDVLLSEGIQLMY